MIGLRIAYSADITKVVEVLAHENGRSVHRLWATSGRRYPHEGEQSILDHSFFVPKPGQGAAFVLSLAGQTIECAIERWNTFLAVQDDTVIIKGGMSGSPIVSTDGKAIGLVSTSHHVASPDAERARQFASPHNPVLRDNLPAWFFRRRPRPPRPEHEK